MRDEFPDVVEKGRHKEPLMGSKEGDPRGLFFVGCPETGRHLQIVVGSGLGWDHVSVVASGDTPTWDEMCFVKELFFEPDECVVQFHPRKRDYINVHEHVLHLWRKHGEDFPMPPQCCV